MLEADPADIRAVIVGIDVFAFGEDWTLNGPAKDALRTVDWLLAANVKAQNIALFLSPDSWNTERISAWAATCGLVERVASAENITRFIDVELVDAGGSALLMHWGGHGSVDSKTGHNCLFTADAEKKAPYCIGTQDLLKTLTGDLFEHLRQQVFIFDVCAAAYSRLALPVQPNVRLLQKSNDFSVSTQQCAMYAASLGQLATNISARGAGLFSELIFKELQKYPSPTIDQFAEAFATVKAQGSSNGLMKQQPRLQFKAKEAGELEVVGAVPTFAGQELYNMIRQRGVAIDVIRRLFLCSLPILARRLPEGTMDSWLQELADTRPRDRGYGAPLIEFALRLSHAIEDPEFDKWAALNEEPAAVALVRQKLEDEATADQAFGTLFIAIESDTSAKLQWWTEGPDASYRSPPRDVTFSSDDIKAALEACLPAILPMARSFLPAWQLRIGFIVPVSLFSYGLDNLRIVGDGSSYLLGEEYPVLFHWYDRTMRANNRYAPKMQQGLVTLGPRILQGNSAMVEWLEAADKRDPASRYDRAFNRLQSTTTGAVCVGVDHPFDSATDVSIKTLEGCLSTGIPCLFWLQLPRGKTKAAKTRSHVETAFASVAARTAPVCVWKGRKIARADEKIVPIGVVWDAPDFAPAYKHNERGFQDSQ